MKKSLKLFITVVLIVFVVFTAVVFANIWRTDTNYNQITIKGNFTIPEEDILKYIRVESDTVLNLEELDITIIQDRIIKHPEVKKVTVAKQPPSELLIEIVEKKPIALINFGSNLKLVDGDFEIFPFVNAEMLYDLPVISGLDLKDLPENIRNLKKSEDLKTALFLINLAYHRSKTLYSYISEINMHNKDKIIVYSTDMSIPFYFPRKNADETDRAYSEVLNMKLHYLAAFIEQIVPDKNEEKFEYVDLRFSNQIISKTKNQIINDDTEIEENG